MTDNEIIQALECCIANKRCDTCPRLGMNCCMNLLIQNALDLINRQKAEIKQLETIEKFATKTIEKQSAEIERLQQNIDGLNIVSKNHIKCIQSEAIKDFSERLCKGRVSNDPVVIAVQVELEEMDGGEE